MIVIHIDNFGGEFDGNGWHNIIRWSISTEGIDNISFASGCISNKDDYIIMELLEWISFSYSSYEFIQ
jgi:hypothetical protein